MQRFQLFLLFIVITAIQLTAVSAGLSAVGLSDGQHTWLTSLARVTYVVLAFPLGLPATVLWISLSGSIDLRLMLLPNALLWAAVICWWLNRRAQKPHSPDVGSVPS